MEDTLRQFAATLALGVEIAAAFLVAIGAVQAFILAVFGAFGRPNPSATRLNAWRRFGTWLILALEFELGSDIIRSAVAPSWNDIGQLAAIAAIRVFLNFFLERDLEAPVRSPEVPASP